VKWRTPPKAENAGKIAKKKIDKMDFFIQRDQCTGVLEGKPLASQFDEAGRWQRPLQSVLIFPRD